MNKEVVRNQFIRDREFLRNLYETEKNSARVKQILTFGTDNELNSLLKFLHFLSKGEIKIKKQNFDAIIQNHKLLILKKTVEKKQAIKQMLTADREVKLKFLRQLWAIYPNLLFCLFNE